MHPTFIATGYQPNSISTIVVYHFVRIIKKLGSECKERWDGTSGYLPGH